MNYKQTNEFIKGIILIPSLSKPFDILFIQIDVFLFSFAYIKLFVPFFPVMFKQIKIK